MFIKKVVSDYSVAGILSMDCPVSDDRDRFVLRYFADIISFNNMGLNSIRLTNVRIWSLDGVSEPDVFETSDNNPYVLELVMIPISSDSADMPLLIETMRTHKFGHYQFSVSDVSDNNLAGIAVFIKDKIMSGAKITSWNNEDFFSIKFPLREDQTFQILLVFDMLDRDLLSSNRPAVNEAVKRVFDFASEKLFDYFESRDFITNNREFVKDLCSI